MKGAEDQPSFPAPRLSPSEEFQKTIDDLEDRCEAWDREFTRLAQQYTELGRDYEAGKQELAKVQASLPQIIRDARTDAVTKTTKAIEEREFHLRTKAEIAQFEAESALAEERRKYQEVTDRLLIRVKNLEEQMVLEREAYEREIYQSDRENEDLQKRYDCLNQGVER